MKSRRVKASVSRLIVIIIASSHKEHRIEKNAPTAYAFQCAGITCETHWGYGSARETQEMLAQGLNRAAEQALIEEPDLIEVVVHKLGFKKYLTEFVPKWRKEVAQNPAFERNNLRVWKQLHEFYLLGDLAIRVPTADEKARMRQVRSLAKDVAVKALDHCHQDSTRFAAAGVFVTDEDETT